MSNMPKFNNVIQEFIEQSLKTGAGIGRIIEDIAEIYPQFKAAAEDKQARDQLYERIKKIKTRMPEPEKKAAWGTVPHDLSAEWRVAYFRALLNATEDVSVKIRLLKEIRTEVAIIDKQNKEEEPERKEAYEKQKEKQREAEQAKVSVYTSRDPQNLADWDARHYVGMRHGDTNLAIKSYEKIGDGRYRRKSDGVVVDKDGTPEKVGNMTHIEWIAEQEQRGLYICDQKIEAEIIPSPLVLDKVHREAYKVACQQGWIFADSVLPKKAYKQITDYRYYHYEYHGDCPENQYRRICDGVVVDKLGIPFTAGEKDHHTWLSEQEGIYNYDPNVADKTPAIKTLLATPETEESKHV